MKSKSTDCKRTENSQVIITTQRVWLACWILTFICCSPIMGSPRGNEPEKGLVFYSHFDQTDENPITDASGNNHEVKQKNVQWVSGIRGHALQFDGKGSVKIIPSQSTNFRKEITISFWAKIHDESACQAVVMRYKTDLNKSWWGFFRQAPENGMLPGCFSWVIDYKNSSGESVRKYYRTMKLQVKEWYHHVMTVNEAGKLLTYINGERKSAETLSQYEELGGTSAEETLPLSVGSSGSDGMFFSGVVDEFKIYNRALESDEIKQYYETIQIKKNQ